MAPIGVGLVGLSGKPQDKSKGGVTWAENAHLPFLKASPHFEIVALLNSSAESAKAAIARYGLPAGTKAYGDPEDLAADKNVELVVCCTRVDVHFSPIKPSIIAGKAIYVEWPLEASLSIAQEMVALAKKHNNTTIVGLQGSFAPVMRKLKNVLDSGRIGKVVSSSLNVSLGNAGGKEREGTRYFVDRKIGGNVISIAIGHVMEFVTYVLGDINTSHSLLSIGHPTVDIVASGDNVKVIEKGVNNTVPDQIKILGTVGPLKAPISLNFRGGATFPGVPVTAWEIVGQKGIIRLTSPWWGLNVGVPDTKIEFFDIATGEVEHLEAENDELADLPNAARNIARLYEAYRQGSWWPDWEWAVKRHEFLEDLWRSFDEGNS